MNLRFFLSVVFIFVVFSGVFLLNQSLSEKQSTKISSKEEKKENFEIEETIEQKAYRIGYQKGRNAMVEQINLYTQGKLKYTEDSERNSKYTVMESENSEAMNFEVPEEDKERIEDIMTKAYIEGYHKATDLFVCPRAR